MDSWKIINYSREVPLQNGICILKGKTPWEIVVVSHHDQSPQTIEGADNDGSGVSIMLHLGEILPKRELRHTIVFLFADAEEYGMIGSRRFLFTHPNVDKIGAAISVDNSGKFFYDGVLMVPRGQFRGFGDIYLQLEAQKAAKKYSLSWIPIILPWWEQLLMQMVPISFMDQGPFVARGIPAFGFTGRVPVEYRELHWRTYHSPEDTIKYQSPEVLGNVGKALEALILELQKREDFPRNRGPYLYFSSSGFLLEGFPLWVGFFSIVGGFFLLSMGISSWKEKLKEYKPFFFYWSSFFLPWIGGVLLLYLFVKIGWMDKYHLYPATSKDPAIYYPKWKAVIALVLWLILSHILFRKIYKKYFLSSFSFSSLKRGVFFLFFLASCYTLLLNPFSLVLLVPHFFWYLMREPRNIGVRVYNIGIFLLGGILFFSLLYFFGFVIMRNDLAILWYLLMMISVGMVSFPTVLVGCALLSGGVSLLVFSLPGDISSQDRYRG